MSNPDTAIPERSIWRQVGRGNFIQNVKELQSWFEVPGNSDTGIERPISRDNYDLDFESEEELANGFAYIAAHKDGVRSVSAATVQALAHPNRLVLTLSANDGISNDVQSTFRCIADILQQCALNPVDLKAKKAAILESVISLNAKRIRSRLAYQKQDRFGRKVEKHTTALVCGRLTGERMRIPDTCRDSFGRLLNQLKYLDEMFQSMPVASKDQDLRQLQDLVLEISHVYHQNTNLSALLKQCGTSNDIINSKEMRQFGKIADYARICHNLVKKAISLPNFFQRFEIYWLPRFIESRFPINSRQKFHVHAEIQLVTHFELNNSKRRPRILGASKNACFLCNALVRRHGLFYLSQTHGRLYEQWTVPDLEEYGRKARKRLSTALVQMNQDLVEALAQARRNLLRRSNHPPQSVLNVDMQRFLSPFSLSARSKAGSANHKSKASSKDQAASTMIPRSLQERATMISSSNGEVGKSLSTRRDLPGKLIFHTLNPGSATRIDAGWVELSISCEDDESQAKAAPQGLGEVEVTTESRFEAHLPVIDVMKLPTHERGSTLKCRDNEDKSLSFVLRCGGRTPVQVRCRWPNVVA